MSRKQQAQLRINKEVKERMKNTASDIPVTPRRTEFQEKQVNLI